MSASPACGSGLHSSCPGYHRVGHPCTCGCHKASPPPPPEWDEEELTPLEEMMLRQRIEFYMRSKLN